VIPKVVQELTNEDICLENTLEFAILHETDGPIKSESSASEFPDKSKTEEFPALSFYTHTFPEDPISYILSRVQELNKIVAEISRRARRMESYLHELPFDVLKSDPKKCMSFADIVRTILQKSKLLDEIANFKIYLEEEIKLTTGVRDVYLETLKCTELFQSFARMVDKDKEILFKILRDFHAEDVPELRPILASHNEPFNELKRVFPLPLNFVGVGSYLRFY